MIRYQITDSAADVRGDVDFVQIRAPRLNVRELIGIVKAVPAGPRVLVNDRADVAIACGAAGVHLRADSVSPLVIRKLGIQWITIACHDEEELGRAEGADYALLSPVFSPFSKADSRQPLGLREFGRLVRLSPVPVIALGGITEANAASCLAAGAVGIAGITLFH